MKESTLSSSAPHSSDKTKQKLMNPGFKLSIGEKIGYGVGDTASNILYQAWGYFLMIFYTDVFGIDATVASFMFLVTRLWDMINDPLMGMLADRTHTRWGRFRPYLLWISVPYGVLACAMFITPDWSQNMKVVYAYVTYILATMAYTAINIPYSSMMVVMTPSPKERTTLAQYRFFFAFIGGMLITTFTLPLAKFFGNNPNHPGYDAALGYSQSLGFQVTMGVFGAIAIILLLITFITTRERVLPPKTQKTDIKADLKDVVRNIPWVIIFIATTLWVTHNIVRNGMITYYFNYVNGTGENIFWSFRIGALGLDFNYTTAFLTFGTFGMLAGIFFSSFIKKFFDRKNIVIGLTFASIFASGCFYWLPPQNFWLLTWVNIIWSVIYGALPVFIFAMFADVADYHEWKFKRQAAGLLTAGVMFAIKMGVAFGGFIGLFILGMFGYQKGMEITPEMSDGIKMIFSIIPAGFILLSCLMFYFYPINDKLMAVIEKDLKDKHIAEGLSAEA